LGELELGRGGRIGDGDIELEVELVLEEVVDIPALAGPARALGIGGGDPEPVVILGLVHLRVGDQRPVLLLQPLRPRRAVPRPGLRRQQRDLGQRRLRVRVPTLHFFLLTLDLMLLKSLGIALLFSALVFWSVINNYNSQRLILRTSALPRLVSPKKKKI
jgi:hypothetical protein